VSTGLHPHAHLHSLCREIAVELLRFLVVLQSLLSQFSSVGVHKSNLLETRVVTTYNHHGRFLSPELLWLVSTTEVYSGLGADIVMKSISLTTGSLAKSPSMRRPISVKSDFVRSLILPGLGPPLPPSFHPHSLVSDFSLGASWAFSFQSVLPPDFRGIMPLTYPTGSVRIS
jgi:hypothetical protein